MHCHVDLYPTATAVVDRIAHERMYVLAVTTTPLAWQGTRRLTAKASRIQVGLGLHPELVAERHHEVDLLCRMIRDAKYIGEIGLDGSPAHKSALPLQQRIFNRILETCVLEGGRLMTIHSRGAASAVLDALEAHPSAGKAILHWFSGTSRELERAVRLGCWFSAGPAMLRTKKGMALVEAMPSTRVLTETDGPFARRDDKPLMPWDVAEAISRLGALWHLPYQHVDNLIGQNLRNLLAPSEVK